jgi:hypothetical protein
VLLYRGTRLQYAVKYEHVHDGVIAENVYCEVGD